jgi:sugar phosphate isomerase/epimerase
VSQRGAAKRFRLAHSSMRKFRIGATSFVHPASWIDNVEQLAGRVEDIELLLFDIEGPHGVPSEAERAALRACKARAGLSYSVHMPLAPSLASRDEARRQAGVATVLRALQVARELHADQYVLHVYVGDHEGDLAPSDLDAFRARAARSIESILASGVEPRALCVEQLDYDLAWLWPVIERYGLSIALDVGHLHRDGRDLREQVRRFLPHTRIVQWHGTEPGGRDHRSLAHFPREQSRWLLETLLRAGFDGTLTLEVFRPGDFETSLEILHGLLAELSR